MLRLLFNVKKWEARISLKRLKMKIEPIHKDIAEDE